MVCQLFKWQATKRNGKLSDLKNIDISIMQGSILGPILFLCFINDLPNCTELLTLLFADDTACLIAGSNLKEILAKANIELQKIANWFRANKMAVNVSKMNYIIFKPRGAKIELGDNEGIFYNDNEIGCEQEISKITKLCRVYNENPNAGDRTYKLLGLLLDEHISFDDHCRHTHSKIAQSNFIINRSKNFLPSSALKTLYFSLIHPHLLYCLPLYGCTSQKNLKKLELIQKNLFALSLKLHVLHTQPLSSKNTILCHLNF
jgi:Reverse transcriptase (RNA-dependent DNA polymerase)